MPVLVFALCSAIWSTTYYAIRVCLRGYAPLTGAALRFTLAATILFVVVTIWRAWDRSRLGRGAEEVRERVAIAAAGAINALAYAMVYYAETRITGGAAAVLTAASPFFTAVAARVTGLETFQRRRLIGISVGFSGVVILFFDGASTPSPSGLSRVWAMAAIIFSSALLWPTYNVLLKRYAGGVNAVRANLRFLGWTAFWLSLAAVLLDARTGSVPQFGVKPTLALVYLAVMGTVVAWTGYFWMLKRLDISTLSTMVFIQPTMALVVDVAMGDDRLSARAYGGASLVLLGVLLTAVKFRASAPAAAADPPRTR